jgi:hypothetical protein
LFRSLFTFLNTKSPIIINRLTASVAYRYLSLPACAVEKRTILQTIESTENSSREENIKKAANLLAKDGWKKNEAGFLEKSTADKKKTTVTPLEFSISTSNAPELSKAANMFTYFKSNFLQLFIIMLGAGIILGSISSFFAIARYLKK